MSPSTRCAMNPHGDKRKSHPLLGVSEWLTHGRHNVAPTYIQPVIRQLGDRPERNDAPRDTSQGGAAPADQSPPSTTQSAAIHTSPKVSSRGKPGDLIVQSMRLILIISKYRRLIPKQMGFNPLLGKAPAGLCFNLPDNKLPRWLPPWKQRNVEFNQRSSSMRDSRYGILWMAQKVFQREDPVFHETRRWEDNAPRRAMGQRAIWR